jgi:hypothetical protein
MYISSDIDLVIKLVIVLTVTDVPYVPSRPVLGNKDTNYKTVQHIS